MSNEHRSDDAPAMTEDGPTAADHHSASGLARPLQEHLAQKLRSAYHELADKPAFLGDPTVPVEFEYQLQRLEAVEKVRHTEKVRNQGIEAVRSALEDIVAGPLDSEPSDTGPGHRRDEK